MISRQSISTTYTKKQQQQTIAHSLPFNWFEPLRQKCLKVKINLILSENKRTESTSNGQQNTLRLFVLCCKPYNLSFPRDWVGWGCRFLRIEIRQRSLQQFPSDERNFIWSSANLSTINVCITLHHITRCFILFVDVCLTMETLWMWVAQDIANTKMQFVFQVAVVTLQCCSFFLVLFARPPPPNDIKIQVNVIILVYIRILQLTFALRNGGKNYIYTASTLRIQFVLFAWSAWHFSLSSELLLAFHTFLSFFLPFSLYLSLAMFCLRTS